METEDTGHREKPIDTVATVILLLVVFANTAVKTFADLTLAIPVVGEIVYPLALLFTIVVWAGIIFYFVMKLGVFGSAGLAMTIGGVLDLFGLPVGLLGGTLLAIYLANHPKVAIVASVTTGAINVANAAVIAAEEAAAIAAAEAATAAAKEAAIAAAKTGAITAAEEAAEAAAKEATEEASIAAAKEAATTEVPESETLRGKPSETPESGAPGGKPSETPAEKPEVPKEALGEEPTEFEKLQKLLEETPRGEEEQRGNKENEDEELDEAA